jgi:hypothetical protein
MKSPNERADAVIRWLQLETDCHSWDQSVLIHVRDRIAEEVADALDELREGFTRSPTRRERTFHR